uniref:Uncharacterized protein ycf33 n=1 Tax=Actinocyclus subtilis TaxID=1630683 RepID=A0A2U9NQ42_9STRA|nr:hypothetical protein ycf33 [Actinocyclus subtilis]AWT39239.1 hypothetical protein ycf33 [Actinocyclus subtilis]
MNNFWNNIRRYPSFFISSVAGLIVVILTPFTSLIKTPKSRYILIGFILISLITIFFIIKAMLVL